MTHKTLFFITASLLVAALSLALPALELDAVANAPAVTGKGQTPHGAPAYRGA